jgi:hypothetical protein
MESSQIMDFVTRRIMLYCLSLLLFQANAFANSTALPSPAVAVPHSLPSPLLSFPSSWSSPQSEESAGQMPSPSPVLSPLASPLPSSVALPLNLGEMKELLGAFQKAQMTELRALEHQYRFELKELQASQSARLQEWERKEKESRHKYFKEHMDGPTRRTYIQDFIKRREAFRKSLSEERNVRTRDQTGRLTATRRDQAAKFHEFQKFLDKKVRPPLDLWPKPGT